MAVRIHDRMWCEPVETDLLAQGSWSVERREQRCWCEEGLPARLTAGSQRSIAALCQSGSGAEQRKGEKMQGTASGLGPCSCQEVVPASLSSQHGREEEAWRGGAGVCTQPKWG